MNCANNILLRSTKTKNAFQRILANNNNNNKRLFSADSKGVVSIALNNPSTRNALSTQVLESLQRKLTAAKEDPSTRVVVIKAFDNLAKYNGVFCAGHDLKEVSLAEGENKEEYRKRMEYLFSLCSSVMMELSTFPVPTISQIDGIATAAGCQLAASCDLAVATNTSRFATPGVHIGLFCSTPAVPLIRNVSKKHAMELLLTGDMISAQRAYEIGLINRVVGLSQQEHDDLEDDPQEERRVLVDLLDKEVEKLVTSIVSKSKKSIQVGLETLRKQQPLSLQDAYKIADQTMVDNLQFHDASEGISAFLEKRRPDWRDC